jgi:hypothetical protein
LQVTRNAKEGSSYGTKRRILKLRAQAKAKGVSGYKNMSADELKKAIGSGNGSGSRPPRSRQSSRQRARFKVRQGQKTAAKTAGRKTASVKSAPAKTAKRQTTGAQGRTVEHGQVHSEG